MSRVLISVRDIVTKFGENVVHNGVSFEVREGEIFGLLGGSGSGKSTILKEIIMLLRPTAGEITVLGKRLSDISLEEAQILRKRWGVLFQSGALFSPLTIEENIAVTLREYTMLDEDLIRDLVRLKIDMVGLPGSAASLYPAELSGGMKKRAALARALAMDPKLLFLDEPTSGLDPVGAEEFDRLILKLRELLGLTIVVITHDIDSIFTITDRLAVLGDGKVIAQGTLQEVLASRHPFIDAFFRGERAKHRTGYIHGR
ncbi:MAG: sulfate ABC transporter ATP-binding protein [Campylobacteraceae bacterium 4484_4]|nr:MAG: sulfate ABC transporter ATP-binding protein [Campylobacteraceae bacterium 4484_4]